MPTTIAIIPARGGSKSIPRKNLINIGGKPLIAWPIELAKSIPQIDRVILSSEDSEILSVGRKFGAETPFIRPQNLAEDDTTTLPVLQHSLKYLIDQEGYYPDNVLLLYATSPFMRKERILQGIDMLNAGANSVVGVKKVRGLVWKYDEKTNKYKQFYPTARKNRQKMSHLLEEAGNIFFTKSHVLIDQGKIIDENSTEFIYIDEDEVIDIDTMADFKMAEEYLKNKI